MSSISDEYDRGVILKTRTNILALVKDLGGDR